STTGALSITLDTTPPAGTAPDLIAASDSGVSSIDNLTDVTNPTFSVGLGPTVQVGDTVELLLGGSSFAHPVKHSITQADISAGSVNLTIFAGDLGADGPKSISASFIDVAGNVSTTGPLSITLDTTADAGTALSLVAFNAAGGVKQSLVSITLSGIDSDI